MRRIVIVDSDPAEINASKRELYGLSTGEAFATALAETDASCATAIICPYDGDAIPDLDDVNGVVFTGSAVEWNTQDTRAAPLAHAMRAVFAQGVPSFGSCNGLHLAASVLGGISDVSANGREIGLAKDIKLTQAGRVHPMMADRVDGYAVPCVHRDEVVRLPEGAVVLAGNAHTAVQAMEYAQGGIRFWGVQYHPEYTLPFIGQRVRAWPDFDATVSADLQIAHTDPDAANRLAVRYEDMQTSARMTEIKNWLASL